MYPNCSVGIGQENEYLLSESPSRVIIDSTIENHVQLILNTGA